MKPLLSGCRRGLQLALASVIIMVASSVFGVAHADSRSEVESHCEKRTPPFFDCTCVGDRYEALKVQYPDRRWDSLLLELLTPDCYSAEQIHQHYATTDCSFANKRAERIRARFEGRSIPAAVARTATIVDCQCYADHITEEILTMAALSTRIIAGVKSDATVYCPAE